MDKLRRDTTGSYVVTKVNELLLRLATWMRQFLECIPSSVLEVEGQEKNWTQPFAMGLLGPVMDADRELTMTTQCIHNSSGTSGCAEDEPTPRGNSGKASRRILKDN